MDHFKPKNHSSDIHFLNNLPNEIIQHIFLFLDFRTLVQLSKVNQHLKENADALINRLSYWKKRLNSKEPHAAIETLETLLLEGNKLESDQDVAASSSSMHHPRFDHDVITHFWLTTSQHRDLSEKILMCARCFLSKKLSCISESQAFKDYWSDVVASISNDTGEASNAIHSQNIRDNYMKLFTIPNFSGYTPHMLCQQFSLPETLFRNESVIKALLSLDGNVLGLTSSDIKNNETMVLTAVQQKGYALRYASTALKDSEAIVYAAVKQNGFAIKFASERLQNNKSIVHTAVGQDGYVLEYVSETLQDNKSIVLTAVSKDGQALEFASESLKTDEDVVRAAVSQDGYALLQADDTFRDNEDIILTASNNNYHALEFASRNLLNNVTVMLTAANQDVNALRYASDELINDPDFLREAADISPSTASYLTDILGIDLESMGAIDSHNGMPPLR